MLEEKQNAVVYSRVGTKEQATKGYSLKVQQKECEKFIHSKGLKIIKYFSDIGSANGIRRQGLQDLLTFCKNNQNQVKYVVIARLDRLCRSLVDYVKFADLLDSLGIKILINGEKNEFDAAGNLQRNFLLKIMNFENELISERIKTGIQRRKEQLQCQK